jgi:hypothetical protein
MSADIEDAAMEMEIKGYFLLKSQQSAEGLS